MNSQKMIRLSVIAALAGVYGSAFAGTAYDKGTNFIDQTYENVVGTQPSEHKGAVMAFYPTNADDVSTSATAFLTTTRPDSFLSRQWRCHQLVSGRRIRLQWRHDQC